ncbi:hypothetical protein EMCRGX_G003258 [Ephydatia muelleri]
MGNEKDVTVVEETQFHLNSQLQHDQVQQDQVQQDQVQHNQVQQDQVQQDQVQKEEPTSMSEATQKQTSSSPHLSLVGSKLTGAQLQQAKIFAKKHGGRIATCFNGSTTHIIVNVDENGRCTRTLKYLQEGVVDAAVVVSSWVMDSLSNHMLLSVSKYSVTSVQ